MITPWGNRYSYDCRNKQIIRTHPPQGSLGSDYLGLYKDYKKLRTKNNYTQETLATAIGVTPQAISRWEAEGGYPDIELLPLIADFFSVSTDELLGYKISEREKRLIDIKKEMSSLSEVGTIEERINFSRIMASCVLLKYS